MKKTIVVIDPSIMIHKIVQLAFPEDQHDVLIYDNYPLEGVPGDGITLALVSADLPGHDDVTAVATEIKSKWNCKILLMIPKFFEFDTARALESGVDGIIEKPFTSDALREKVADLTQVPEEVHEMDSLSPDELESIADDEFMLSEEDLMEIGEEELADVDLPEDLDVGTETDTEELPDTGELLEEAPMLLADETDETPLEVPDTPEFVQEPEPGAEAESAPEPEMVSETGDVVAPAESASPFDEMELGEELDSIDFGDLDEGDQLLTEADLPESPQAPEPEMEIGPQTIQEAAMAEGMDVETETTSPEPASVMEPPATGEPEPAVPDETAEPDVQFAIEEEPQTVQVEEYQVERQDLVEPEPTPEPIDLSHDEADSELLLPPSGGPAKPAAGGALTEADIERIAELVVQKLSDKAVRDIAWEVIPVVAEEVVKSRIRQLEQEDVDS